ncbi:hypothetical protein C2S53_016701 [Perilla frutescens var. hirtella]|uniref:N-acetyltransferase domain-containing protein n=1 Tax=Perilla frutescens var. hirtella TaxID=608512 RepID=A0AAD4P0F6_PERFH|nr:hypothetical protein C2S51_021242 [Perilla frutescens var. frutescens]KAH6821591.1 hypothetical protein C2S53_016701 [Perilla frutescens var. hirtella]
MEKYSDSDVTIRPLDISDADDAALWYMDENVSKFCSWDAFATRESAVEHFIKSDLGHPWNRAICVSGRAVGSVTVSPFGGNDRCRAELGYMVSSEYWGRGVATRAVKLAANAVFVEWGHLERLEAVVDVENAASQRVVEKAGFVREGVLRKYYLLKGKPRDALIFSLLSTDPHVNYFMDA